jgi:hemimethylated DNA binding protein
MRKAKFAIGQVVKHRVYPFRGVIFDVDPVFANTEEWLASIPEEVRPRRDHLFYHLLAENRRRPTSSASRSRTVPMKPAGRCRIRRCRTSSRN